MINYSIEDIIDQKYNLLSIAEHCWDSVDQLKVKGFKFDPDWDQYAYLNSIGCVRYYVVKDDDKQVGFAIFLIGKSLHIKGKYIGSSDSIYIYPEYRGIGIEFINLIKKDLKEEGVSFFSINFKSNINTDKISQQIDCEFNEKVLEGIL